jgi:hypothetical protein
MPWLWASSAALGLRHRRLFDEVEAYVMFVGHPRSGHSLVGALLGAHPDTVIAHELDALRFVRLGFRRDQLFELLLARDAEFARADQRTKSGYQYAVPGASQGTFRRLRVIGDKKGGGSTSRLGAEPGLLDRLRAVVRVPVRIVNVVRNPYDNITTLSRRSGKALDDAAASYFRRCETVERIKAEAGDDFAQVRFETFVDDPITELLRLCGFLGIEGSDDFVSAAVSIVAPRPHRSRLEADWTPGLVDSVRRRMERFGFLDGYGYVEPAGEPSS